MPITLTNPVPATAQAHVTGSEEKLKKIHQAAGQFEALLIGEMLKSAREGQSEGWLGSGGGTGDDTAVEMAESQLSNALAKDGGLGLAKMIEGAMTKAIDKPDPQNTAETPLTGSAVSSENKL